MQAGKDENPVFVLEKRRIMGVFVQYGGKLSEKGIVVKK